MKVSDNIINGISAICWIIICLAAWAAVVMALSVVMVGMDAMDATGPGTYEITFTVEAQSMEEAETHAPEGAKVRRVGP